MAKRLSDTAAIASTPLRGGDGSESKSVTVRAIDNGFLCCESHSKADGTYAYSELYYAERPKISETTSERSGTVGGETLSGAKAALR